MGQVDWLGLGAPILSVIFAKIGYICISSKKLHAIRKHVSLWGSGFSVAMQSPDIASIQFAALLTRFPNLAHQPADDDEVAALASTSDGCVLRPFGCCSASERHRATIALAMVKCHLWRLEEAAFLPFEALCRVFWLRGGRRNGFSLPVSEQDLLTVRFQHAVHPWHCSCQHGHGSRGRKFHRQRVPLPGRNVTLPPSPRARKICVSSCTGWIHNKKPSPLRVCRREGRDIS